MNRLLCLFLLASLLSVIASSDQQPTVPSQQGASQDVYLPGQNMINSAHRRKLQSTTDQPADPLPGKNMINSGMRKGIKTQHGTVPNRKQQQNY